MGAIILGLLNQKGGSGKTTTAVNLAAALAELGRRILLVDLDSQASATRWLGMDEGDGVYRVLVDRVDLQSFIVPTGETNIDVVPASPPLALVEQQGRNKPNAETALARKLSPLRDRWDFILLDSPPALGLLAINALAAADSVLVPVEAHGIALAGLADLVNTVDLVREEGLNPTLKIDHVLACRVDRTRQAREAVEVLREQFPTAMLRTFIRESARLADNFNFRTTILKHAPTSTGAADYRAVARELLERYQLAPEPPQVGAAVGGTTRCQ